MFRDLLTALFTADSRRLGAICLIAVGALLLVAGVTNGFTTKDLALQMAPNHKFALVIGALSFVVGVSLLVNSKLRERVPSEFDATISTRVANLSAGQTKLFTIIRFRRAVMLPDITLAFGSPATEVYWRLEVLRLLGLINKENVSDPRAPLWKYGLTAEAEGLGQEGL